MSTEFDTGPLTWVKGEIDLAMRQAGEKLAQFAADTADSTPLRQCQTHLHQVSGAIQMVGLEGVARLGEAIEKLVGALEKREVAISGANLDLIDQGIAALLQYLEDLLNGQPDQPLRLFPVYQALLAARGVEKVSESELFFPDLSIRAPRSPASQTLDEAQLGDLFKAQRARYQRGLLGFLRNPQDEAALQNMHEALVAIEQTQTVPAHRTFWWSATGLIESLQHQGLEINVNLKHLCGSIDQQIRRLAEGSPKVAERLLRDVLFYVARSTATGERGTQIRDLFELDAYLPATAAQQATETELERIQPLLRELRDLLAPAKDAWLKFTSGSHDSLAGFHSQAQRLAERAAALKNAPLDQLLRQIENGAAALAAKSADMNEMVAMEMATALLLAENTLDRYLGASDEFTRQAAVQATRLQAALEGRLDEVEMSDIPLLDEMSRKAQEKLLLAQVGQEIQSNLKHIEQVLDAFFRDTDKRDELPGLKPFLKQIHGALNILQLDPAVRLLDESARLIDSFSAPEHELQQIQMEQVAEGLSSLGFYVEAIQRGRTDAVQIIDSALARLNLVAPAPVEEAQAETAEEQQASVSVEAGLADQKRHAQTLLAHWLENPSDAVAKAELQRQLVALQQDAELVADGELKALVTEAKRLLEQAETPTSELAAATAALVAPKMAAVAPSTETTRLAEEADETIDAEMLEIFLEEADEVLATVTGSLDLCRAQPRDKEALTTLRRSFHTLKGSGRMVGLWDLGEVAWAIEQVLNTWLQDEKSASPELLSLLDQACRHFLDWVAALKANGSVKIVATELVAEADRLRTGGAARVATEAAAVPAAVTVEIPAEPEPEIVAEPVLEIAALPLEEVVEAALSGIAPAAEMAPPVEAEIPAAAEAPAEPVEVAVVAPESAVAIPPPVEEAEAVPLMDEEREITVGSVTLPQALFNIFINEAEGHLATMREQLGELVRNPQIPVQHDFMRAAHTLCGISRTVGFPAVSGLGFPFEMWLQELLQHAEALAAEQLELVSEVVAELGSMLEAIRDNNEPQPSPQLIQSLEQMLRQAREAHAPVSSIEENVPAAPPVQEAAAPAVVPPEVREAVEQTTEQAPAEPAPERRVIRDDIDPDLLPIFLEEAHDLFPLVGGQLRAWRANADDSHASDGLQRSLHTIKGSARMAGAMRLGELTHNMEAQVLAAVESGQRPDTLFDTLESEFDRMGDVLEQLRGGGPEAEAEDASAVPETPEAAAPAKAAAEPETAKAMLRMRADVVDRLVNEAGEVSIARSRIEGEMQDFKRSLLDLTESINRLRGQLREIEIQAESQMQSRQSHTRESHEEFDPLEFDRFTRLQEVTRMMAESVNDVASVQHNLLKNMNETEAALLAQARMTKELQQELLHARMVPLGSIAERLFRIVRQTSKELDKRATLEIVGEQVELDRSVLERMTAPFEHLLRNAIDHGLESREARLAAGKGEAGAIELQARQEGNEILLTLRDDGRGLDLDGIRRKAIARGMLTADSEVAPAQLMELIFSSGFSTAAEVTQVSGRGIGMDVVRNEIAGLGGRVEVTSEPGKGATFSIYLPLTLAVTQAVLVRAAANVYALPSTMVDQVQELKADALAKIYEQQQVLWQGNIYPLHYFPRLLGDRETSPVAQRNSTVMLLHSGAQRVAVHVDELLGNREIVVKNIGPQLARVPGVSGATVLGNGKVVLILNPVLLAQRQGASLLAPQPSVVPQLPAAQPVVMIVDDSLTVRKITSKLLIREGYQVVTAKDGVDALQALEEVTPQVMLVDIEMPRMDGFELTKNVRGNAATAHIPIIMITSRTAEKHRNYAEELGVNVYFGKPFQEEALLQHIASFVKNPPR